MMKPRTLKLFRSLLGTLTDLSLSYRQIMVIAEHYSNSIDNYVIHRGKVTSAKHFKDLYLFCRNISLEIDLPAPLPFVATDSKGIPKVIKPLYPLLTGTPDDRRIGLTISRFYESIYCEPNPDLSSITDESTGQVDNLEFEEYILQAIPRITRRRVAPDNFKIISRSKQGPNGPVMTTCHYDAVALKEKGILNNLNKLSSIFPKWKGFEDYINRQIDLTLGVLPKEIIPKLKVGKLSFLPEAGGKTRTIAIGDYGSQIALKPCHDIVMNILKKMETDGTWDQDKQSKRIINLSLGHKCYSFDLSSATDRFPIQPQQQVVKALFGTKYSKGGKSIMIDRPFQTKDKEIFGRTGQPLGMYSSGAVFALTHHLLIEFAAFKEGINSFREYAVLGDDVVIGNEAVASRYEMIMTEYGVSINRNKSIVSQRGQSQIEFAKRLFIEGQEISGLKYTILDSSSSNGKSLPDLFKLMNLRGYSPNPDQFFPTHIRSDKLRKYATVIMIEAGFKVRLDKRVTLSESFNSDLKKEIFRLRIANLEKQRDLIFLHLEENKPFKGEFDKVGICIDPKQIDPQDGHLSEINLHPAVGDLNRKAEQVIDLLEELYMLDSTATDLVPGPLPMEYIPSVKNTVYFGDRKSLLTNGRSSLVIKAFEITTTNHVADPNNSYNKERWHLTNWDR